MNSDESKAGFREGLESSLIHRVTKKASRASS